MSQSADDKSDDAVYDISLFVDNNVAKTFACAECGNVPRKVINDNDGAIYCSNCVTKLSITNPTPNTVIDKMINTQLKMKCPNINTKISDDNKDNDDDNDDNDDNDNDVSSLKNCAWIGNVSAYFSHNLECPFATVSCALCGNYTSLRYIIGIEHENECDEVPIECELKCGKKLYKKDQKKHRLNECIEALLTCSACNRSDIKRKNFEKHTISECPKRNVICKYASYGCDINNISYNLLDKHYADYGIYHLELKLNLLNKSLRDQISSLEFKCNSQTKIIEHLKYRNCKLQMQIHQKLNIPSDFLIIFESSHEYKNSFISSINFNYNSSIKNNHIIKPLNHKKGINNIIYKRIKDCSYCFASNVLIDKIIGITSKSKQQHISKCVNILNNCTCTFNIIYRIGGDSSNNTNICNILGTDVVFQLPSLLIPRYNHRVIYSTIHGLLAVGGEPSRKDDIKRLLKAEKDANKKDKNAKKKDKDKDKDKDKKKKVILNTVEQLKLAPMQALNHYYAMRNLSIKKDEQKLSPPPEPELKWRNLSQSMKYKRDCPSVALYKSGERSFEQLFVAGGWNEKDTNFVEMYNFHKREWREVGKLNVKRNSSGICEWKEKNNNMIVIGGWNKKTTQSVEEYDAHKNAWYMMKNTNFKHKYYPACKIYHDLNPFINTHYGVIVVIGNDGRLYGDEYIKKQQIILKNKQNKANAAAVVNNDPAAVDPNPTNPNNIDLDQPIIKNDWGFIEFYDPRDWMKKWTVIDHIPAFLKLHDDQAKNLYFQSILAANHAYKY